MFRFLRNIFKSEYEKQVELRKDYLALKFEDSFVSQKDFFTIGKIVGQDRYYLSFLAATSQFAEMSVYFEISEQEYNFFLEDIENIKPLLKRCRERKEDHRLFDKNGKNNWSAL